MPKSAQQILEEYRGIGYEDRTRRNSLLSNASAGLSKMAGEINDSIELAMEESRDVLEDNEIDEMGMEFKADFFKLSRFADALKSCSVMWMVSARSLSLKHSGAAAYSCPISAATFSLVRSSRSKTTVSP